MGSWNRMRTKSTAVISLAFAFEKADESILPAMYKYISRDFNASPKQMGALSLCRGVSQALTSPIGGISGHVMNRVHVIFYGCLIWACMTGLFGLVRWAPYPLVIGYIVWGFNGLGLALVVPNAESVMADYYKEESRGKIFGLLYFTAAVGAVIGSTFATNVAGLKFGGIHGWQFVVFALAVTSIVIGVMNIFIAKDPLYVSKTEGSEEKDVNKWKDAWEAVRFVMRVPTFLILIFQGTFGTMPWKAFAAFATLYLQLIGMSDVRASLIQTSFLIGTALGGLLGGTLGDWAAKVMPKHGRILICQIGVLNGIPMILIIFLLLPRGGSSQHLLLYMAIFFLHGLLINWAGPSCNNPLYAEIVPEHMRNIIYAFDRCLEEAISSSATYFTGYLASALFGYNGNATASGDPAIDLPRADALGKAMMWFSVVPWILCIIVYSGLHFTYPHDKAAAAAREGRSESLRAPLLGSPLFDDGARNLDGPTVKEGSEEKSML